MSKFDRGVFIFIALGIWALAMTQVFETKSVVASVLSAIDQQFLSAVTGTCPNRMSAMVVQINGSIEQDKTQWDYLLVTTYEELKRNPYYFR